MGFIRGGLFILCSFLLFLVFLVGFFFLTLNLSLNYENVQEGLNPIVQEFAETEINFQEFKGEDYEIMKQRCNNLSEVVFNEQDYSFAIPCEVVSQGSEEVIDYGIEEIIEENYYKNYDCGFFNCFKKDKIPFFLISQQTKNKMKTLFYYSLISAIILIFLIFLLIEHKINLFILIGALLMISSLPFMKLESFVSLFVNSFYGIFKIFFSDSYSVFLVSFILGLILLCFGLILKFFNFGLKLSNFFLKIKEKLSKNTPTSEQNKSKVAKVVVSDEKSSKLPKNLKKK